MSITDAKRLLSYNKLSICGIELSLHPDVAISLPQRKRKVQSEDKVAVNTIQSTNLPEITEKKITLMLEEECNEKGDIIQMDPGDKQALVRMKTKLVRFVI